MRRNDREITDEQEIERFIAKEKILRIGFCDNGEVYIVPVNYGYAFDNGVSFLVGYESAKYERDDLVDFKVKRIPVFVNYKLNPNFNIWIEAGFNAGSDHGASKSVDKTVFSVGARYTF